VDVHLRLGLFDWGRYIEVKVSPGATGDMLERFENHHWDSRERNARTMDTWKVNYATVFSKLNPAAGLTEEALVELVRGTKPSTRNRLRYALALGALARFAGLPDGAIKALRGNYGAVSTIAREIPSDDEIEAQWHPIKPHWLRWAYGMLATYGLRPHEIYRLDTSLMVGYLHPIRVLEDSKSGPRLVYPNPPAWVDKFNLLKPVMFKSTLESNRDMGKRITTGFKTHHVPFPPYHLRHAWAVRAVRGGMDSTMAARMLGHSLVVHNRTYQRWITEADVREGYALWLQPKEEG
jgi:integrase